MQDPYKNRVIQAEYARVESDEKPDIATMAEEIRKLQEKVGFLMQKRIGQVDIIPDSIKMRHIGEGVRFIRSGLEADLPATGESALQGSAFYWCTDSFKLKIWTGTVWKSATLS